MNELPPFAALTPSPFARPQAALNEEGKNLILESPFVLEGRGLLVRVFTPLTAVTPTTAEPTHARYFSLDPLLPTYFAPFTTGARAG